MNASRVYYERQLISQQVINFLTWYFSRVHLITEQTIMKLLNNRKNQSENRCTKMPWQNVNKQLWRHSLLLSFDSRSLLFNNLPFQSALSVFWSLQHGKATPKVYSWTITWCFSGLLAPECLQAVQRKISEFHEQHCYDIVLLRNGFRSDLSNYSKVSWSVIVC